MSTPVSHSVAGGEILTRAQAYAMRAARVDGMDVDAVREEAAVAIKHVRSGKGPAFIEAITYRYCGHSKSDQLLYRSLSRRPSAGRLPHPTPNRKTP